MTEKTHASRLASDHDSATLARALLERLAADKHPALAAVQTAVDPIIGTTPPVNH